MAANRELKKNLRRHSATSAKAARVRPSGASRVAPKRRVKGCVGYFRSVVKFLVSGLVVASVVGAFYWFNPREKITQVTGRPISQVQIEGSFQYFSKAEAQRVISDHVKGSFLDLDIVALKNVLELNPWVDRVVVAREWPEKLIVRIHEQQPIARWGKSALLNMRGDIIRVKNTSELQHLPSLGGDDRYAKEVMQQYLRVGKLLAQSDLALTSVELDDTLAWQLTLDSGATVKLGRDRLLEKLQYLVTARRGALNKSFDNVRSVDMRYQSGFSVAWKEATTEEDHYVAGN